MELLEKLMNRKAIHDSGINDKTIHKCLNCTKEFDCGIYDCDEYDVYCSGQCFSDYKDGMND